MKRQHSELVRNGIKNVIKNSRGQTERLEKHSWELLSHGERGEANSSASIVERIKTRGSEGFTSAMKKLRDEADYFLGRHTALSILKQKRELWRRVPYLRENDGHAPPIVLAVGDRRRVHAIARRLQNPIFLPETAANLAHPMHRSEHTCVTESGRVAMAIGSVAKIPVLVVETQMGSSAAQIVLNEILSDDLTSSEYSSGRNRINLSRKIVIRIGTAAGINCAGKSLIRVGEVVNATHSVGATGANLQALSRLDFWHPEVYKRFRSQWNKLGSSFTFTHGGHPRVECSTDVVEAIEVAGTRLVKNAYHRGGNITKDSLYAELSNDVFLNLCRTENCRTTEMELSTLAVIAHKHETSFGMISAIVGTLPGRSFAHNEQMKILAEERAVSIGLKALTYLT